MIYLATPYSDPDPQVREERFNEINRVAAMLISAGHHVFSPISMAHPIAKHGDLPIDWDYWEEFDKNMLKACTSLYVYEAAGWRESKGIRAEIKIAEEFGLTVKPMPFMPKYNDTNWQVVDFRPPCVGEHFLPIPCDAVRYGAVAKLAGDVRLDHRYILRKVEKPPEPVEWLDPTDEMCGWSGHIKQLQQEVDKLRMKGDK